MAIRLTANSAPSDLLFVGLDLSLNGTGVALLRWSSEGGWQVPEWFTLRQTHKGPVTKTYESLRLVRVVNKLRDLGVFGSTTLAAIEDYAYGVPKEMTNCIFQLGELGGTVRYHLFSSNVPFIPVPIGTNKKFATGYGKATKRQVADAMSALWGLPRFADNEFDSSDALSLASVAAFKYFDCTLPDRQVHQFQAPLVRPLEVVRCKAE